MSTFLHVISNTLGSGDYTVVYETGCGTVVYEGGRPNARELFEILDGTNGIAEKVYFHELTDEQMENWQENY